MLKFIIEMFSTSIHLLHDLIISLDWTNFHDIFTPKSDRTEAVKTVVEIDPDQRKLQNHVDFIIEDYNLLKNDILMRNLSRFKDDFCKWDEDFLLSDNEKYIIDLKSNASTLKSYITELENREDLLKRQILDLETKLELEQQCSDLKSEEIFLMEKISNLESESIFFEREKIDLESKEIFLMEKISNLESESIFSEKEKVDSDSEGILPKEKISKGIFSEKEKVDSDSEETSFSETPVYNTRGEIVTAKDMHKYPILYHDNRVLLSHDYIHGHPDIIVRPAEKVDVDYYRDNGWNFLLESDVSQECLEQLNLYNRRFERVYGGCAYSYDHQSLIEILDDDKIRFKDAFQMVLSFFPDLFTLGEGPNCFETELVYEGELIPVPMDFYNRLFWDIEEPIPTEAWERSLDDRTYYYLFEKLATENWQRELSINPEIANYPMNEALDNKMLREFNSLTEEEISDLMMTFDYDTLVNYGRLFSK